MSCKAHHANYDLFGPNFDMACKTIQFFSVPNLKLLGPTKTSYGLKEFNFIFCYTGNMATAMQYRQIF